MKDIIDELIIPFMIKLEEGIELLTFGNIKNKFIGSFFSIIGDDIGLRSLMYLPSPKHSLCSR